MDIKTAYATLGLREGADGDEIKAAYRALAQKYDPDQYEAGPCTRMPSAKWRS